MGNVGLRGGTLYRIAARSSSAKHGAPLVSVLLPVHNGARLVAQAIESVLAQTWPARELIVVDDGSTDATADVIAAYEHHVRPLRQRNRGPAAARNAGLDAARGELIAWIDHDDLWPPDRLEVQVNYLVERPDVDVVLGLQEVRVESGVEPPDWFRAERLPAPGEALPNRAPIYPPPTMMARRSAFALNGPFSTKMAISDDADWLLRAHDNGLRIEPLDHVVLIRRLHGANLTYDTPALARGAALALKARIDRKRTRDGGA